MNVSELEAYIKPGSHAHLVGIGGVSMSPLAEVLLIMGLIVTGSDVSESTSVTHLRSLGITVYIGHAAGNISGADFIIRTAAVRDENAEVSAAREINVPVFERAQAWGHIMRSYKNAICISGTHGKTTTTSMCTHILMAAGRDPTVMIGGTLPLLHAGYRIGKNDTIVLESCEYYNSFHSFLPTIAVILNVEADHLDFFRDLEDVKSSFRKFASLVPMTGHILANGDDINTMDALRPLGRNILTFGFGADCAVRADNIAVSNGHTSFDVIYNGKAWAHLCIPIIGRHNVLDAIAASAASIALGIEARFVTEGLSGFTGAGRRFEYKGTLNGAHIYDDYAHHPGELKALLDAVFSLDYKRIILAFQPHTYTRTMALFDEFVEQLSRADLLYLAEIYAAREKNSVGISSRDLADRIPGSVFCPTFTNIEENLRAVAGEGDLILTVGAGDIYRVGETLVKQQ